MDNYKIINNYDFCIKKVQLNSKLAIIIFAILIFPVVSLAFPSEEEIKKMAAPCKKDDECVLFADECRFLKSVLKNKIPENYQSFEIENKITIYTWNPNKKSCPVNLFRQPDWPKNPIPKCIEHVCFVLSKESRLTHEKNNPNR